MEVPEVAEVNTLSPDAFAEALRSLFEGAPRFLHRLAGARPFASDAALLAAAGEVAALAPEEEMVELLDGHPSIGAPPGQMSTLSRAEQDDGVFLEALVEAELAVLNTAYEERFGFRYVVFVAGRPRAAIVPLMKAALRSDRSAELRRGVADALAIAADRLQRARAAARQAEGIGS